MTSETCLLHKTPSLSPTLVSIYPNTCVTEKLPCLIGDERVASPAFAVPSQADSCFSEGRQCRASRVISTGRAFAGLGAKDSLGAGGQNGRAGSGTGGLPLLSPGGRFEVGLFCHVDDIRGRLSGFHIVIIRANGAWKYGGCWPEPHGPCPPTRVNATLPEPIIWSPVWPYTPPPQRRKPGPLLACPGSVRPIRPPPHLSPAPDPPTELCGTQC